MTPLVLVGNPGGRRVALFQESVARLGLPAPRVVAWTDLLARPGTLSRAAIPGSFVRLESPGKDFEVERALLAAGADAAEAEGSPRASRAEIAGLAFDRGRIRWPRQAYLGFLAALRQVDGELAAAAPQRLLNPTADVAACCDKPACHTRLAAAGVPVPRALGRVTGWAGLVEELRARGWRRVFVKLAHGSSASGVVAYETDGRRHQARTTVELVRGKDGLRLYNSRRLRVYRGARAIAGLIDALAPHSVHVEEWLPKAGFAQRTCDLRVLTIAGRARHAVLRLARGPITNLHLLNTRGDLDAFRERVGPEHWEAAMTACETAARSFPCSLHLGIDLMFAPGWRRHAVLEVNAFGDLLPGVRHEGMEPYEAELETLLAAPAAP